MAFIILELDTKPPILEVFSPTTVIIGQDFEFTVQADADMDLGYQEVIITDGDMVEHEYTMSYDDELNRYTCLVDTFNWMQGIAEIKVTLRDDVYNTTTITKSLQALTPSEIDVDVDVIVRGTSVGIETRKVELGVMNRGITLGVLQRELELDAVIREIDLDTILVKGA